MPDDIPSLWPKEFKVDVQTPLSILKTQANLLSKVTSAILIGEVETETGPETVHHRLVVIAPAFNLFRKILLGVIHNKNLPYPAEIRAESLAETVKRVPVFPTLIPQYDTVYPQASDDDELKRLVKQALQSDSTRSTILSLIAKSNESKPAQDDQVNETPI